MTSSGPMRRSFVAIGLMVASSLHFCGSVACSSNGDFDNHEDLEKEVISCEEAFARLEGCCPGFDPRHGGGCVDRTYQKTDKGCDGYYSQTTGHDTPALSRAESECIRELSCAELVKNHVCERAQVAPARSSGHSTYRDPLETSGATSRQDESHNTVSTHPSVCP